MVSHSWRRRGAPFTAPSAHSHPRSSVCLPCTQLPRERSPQARARKNASRAMPSRLIRLSGCTGTARGATSRSPNDCFWRSCPFWPWPGEHGAKSTHASLPSELPGPLFRTHHADQQTMGVPEVSPIRFPVSDVKGFKQHLTEHGCERTTVCLRELPRRQLLTRPPRVARRRLRQGGRDARAAGARPRAVLAAPGGQGLPAPTPDPARGVESP